MAPNIAKTMVEALKNGKAYGSVNDGMMQKAKARLEARGIVLSESEENLIRAVESVIGDGKDPAKVTEALKQLLTGNIHVSASVTEKGRTLAAAESYAKKMSSDLRNAQEATKKAQAEFVNAEQEMLAAQQTAATAEKSAEDVQKKVSDAEKSVEKARENLGDAKKAKKSKISELNAAGAELTKVQKELEKLRYQLHVKERQLFGCDAAINKYEKIYAEQVEEMGASLNADLARITEEIENQNNIANQAKKNIRKEVEKQQSAAQKILDANSAKQASEKRALAAKTTEENAEQKLVSLTNRRVELESDVNNLRRAVNDMSSLENNLQKQQSETIAQTDNARTQVKEISLHVAAKKDEVADSKELNAFLNQ